MRVTRCGCRAVVARLFGVLAFVVATEAVAQTVPTDLALTNLGITGIEQPVAILEPPDGTGRIFIVSRRGGIYVYRNGAPQLTTYMVLAAADGGEQGLLGMAFHPDFRNNGQFYVQLSGWCLSLKSARWADSA